MNANAQPELRVIEDPEKPVGPEVLADSIRRISDGFTRLKTSGVNRAGIEVLVYDATRGVAKGDIKQVLDALESLAKRYTVAKAVT